MRNILLRYKFLFLLGLGLLIGSAARGQDPQSLTLSSLLETAGGLVGSAQFVEARPFLLELVDRFEGEGDDQRKNLESVYLYLGVGYLVDYSSTGAGSDLESAIKWLLRLNEEFPNGDFAVQSMLYMADAYRGLQDFDKAADVYEKLLKPPFEGRLSNQQRLEALEKLVQCLYISQKWQRGLPWFLKFLNETQDRDKEAMAAAALLEGNIKVGNFDEALKFLRYLVGESPARYNLQLNIALIDAGDKLAEEKRYAEAMLMYRMVLTVDEIKQWQALRLKDLETQLDRLKLSVIDQSNERLIELETEIFNVKAQIDALDKLDPYTAALQVRIARNYLLTNRDWESFYAYQDIIRTYPDHANIEDFVYAAFTGATKINKADAVVDLGEKYLGDGKFSSYTSDIVVKLLEYYRDQEDYEEFFFLAKDFVTENPNTEYASSVVFLMGSVYTKLGRYQEMVFQFQDWEKQFPNTEMNPGLFYWIGLGLILERDYNGAWEYFNAIINDYPGSVYAEDALYRRGICYMGIEDYEAARRDFSKFVREYPNTSLRGEVEFFLGEIASALGEVEVAIKHYENVEKYTDNIAFIQNAYFQMGILLEANRQYDRMAQKFEQFIENYAGSAELTGIVFQLGRAYELNLQPQRMLELYLETISDYGDDPYTYGLDDILIVYPEKYYLNRDLIQQNLDLLTKLNHDKAFRELLSKDRTAMFEYLADKPLVLESIKRSLYDANFRKVLVDDTAPIQDWIRQFQDLQNVFPTETPEESFTRLYKQAREDGEETLALRLQYALAQLDNDVDPNRVFTEDDFYYGSPVVLVWMGGRIESYDPDMARESYELVLEDHPESEQVFEALLELGKLQAQEGNYQAAYDLYDKAQSEFPFHENAVDAAMLKADVLRELGRHADARDAYKLVVGNRDWRGPSHAAALFKTGESYLEQGELDQAQAYFERVYIGYPAYLDWAARAYLLSGRTLQQMGRADDARATYDEFLNEEAYRDTEVYQDIKQARSAL